MKSIIQLSTFSLFYFLCAISLMAQPSIQLQLMEIAEGFSKPVDITNAGDARLFIVEQRGRIQIIDEQGERVSDAFLNIENKVGNSAGERGLLGLAFHPNYIDNGFFFVNYTGTNGDTRIARYTRTMEDPNKANPDSEVILLTIDQPFPNHNGGDLQFGADGFLYIGLGDGGAAGDPQNNSQNDNSLLGKMLRIDVDNGDPFSIPADNPFVNDSNIRDEIWATGLRNPWRFSFDRATNDLWIADVGQNTWEEISFQASTSQGGENYGWRCMEGFENFIPNSCATDELLTDPVHVYRTGSSDGASITGGFVYRGTTSPNLEGHYIYGDYVSQIIFSLTLNDSGEAINQELLDSGVFISTFGEDQNGELYMAAHMQGKIFQILSDPISSIDELPSIDFFHTTPNPFQYNLSLSLSTSSPSPIKLTMYNWNGQAIYETTIQGSGLHTKDIDMKKYASGLYYVELLQNGKRAIQKVVKQ